MKLRFRVGRKEASKQARKNGDIEALADAMRALKKVHPKFFQNPFLGCPWVV